MKIKFNHKFEGKIWNSTFGSHCCVLEIRDESIRKVSFSCVNLLSGNVLWKNIIPEKSWWLGLVGIFDEHLFLHKYSSNQKPEPDGLLILNLQTGDVIEKLDGWIFFNCYENILTVYQVENNQPVYLNKSLLQTNCNLSPSPSPVDRQPSSNKNHPFSNIRTVKDDVTHYSDGSPHFPTIYKFLYRLLNVDAVKAVDYLEISNKIIISYYIYRENLFHNYLLVTNRNRDVYFNDLIAETEGIGIDTFCVQSDTLLYVKNENQFIGYEL